MRLFTVLLISLSLLSCNRERLESLSLTHIIIPAVHSETNYSLEGTAAQNFNTVWVEIDNRPVGTFQLPAKVPTHGSGLQEIRVIAGISLNGMSTLREQHAFFNTYSENVNFDTITGSELYLQINRDSIPVVRYLENATVTPIEDFESTGIRMQRTGRSESNIVKVSDPDSIFNSGIPGEPNQFSGYVHMLGDHDIFEIETTESFQFPPGSAPIFVEIHFKATHPFTLGLLSSGPTGFSQTPVVTLNATNGQWRKVYANFRDEINVRQGSTHKFFVGGVKNPDDNSERHFHFDNIKVVF